MKYILDPMNIFFFITVVSFLLYERFLGKIIIFLDIPFVPHTRTVQAAILKYLPLVGILLLIAIVMYLIYTKGRKGS